MYSVAIIITSLVLSSSHHLPSCPSPIVECGMFLVFAEVFRLSSHPLPCTYVITIIHHSMIPGDTAYRHPCSHRLLTSASFCLFHNFIRAFSSASLPLPLLHAFSSASLPLPRNRLSHLLLYIRHPYHPIFVPSLPSVLTTSAWFHHSLPP